MWKKKKLNLNLVHVVVHFLESKGLHWISQNGFPFSFEGRFIIASHLVICRRILSGEWILFSTVAIFDLESGRRLERVNARASTTLMSLFQYVIIPLSTHPQPPPPPPPRHRKKKGKKGFWKFWHYQDLITLKRYFPSLVKDSIWPVSSLQGFATSSIN